MVLIIYLFILNYFNIVTDLIPVCFLRWLPRSLKLSQPHHPVAPGTCILALEEAQKVKVPQRGLEGLPHRQALIPPAHIPPKIRAKRVDLPDHHGSVGIRLHLS